MAKKNLSQIQQIQQIFLTKTKEKWHTDDTDSLRENADGHGFFFTQILQIKADFILDFY